MQWKDQSFTTTVEARKYRGKLVEDARKYNNECSERAAKEKRGTILTEESERHKSYVADIQDLLTAIEREEELQKFERDASATQQQREDKSTETEERQSNDHSDEDVMDLLQWLKSGRPMPKRGNRQKRRQRGATGQKEYREKFDRWLTEGGQHLEAELRSLVAGQGPAGGYLYASEQFVEELLADVTDEVFMRGICRVWPALSGADSIGVPTLATRMSDAEWTAEDSSGNEDTALAFGKRAMTPHPLGKWIYVSKQLIRQTGMAESIVREELARIVGEANENNFLNGDGDKKPLGIFVASDDGVPTSRDVATGNTATSVQYDGLVRAFKSLKKPYQRRASWVFHRDGITGLMLLKDGIGRPIWTPGLNADAPDILLGRPIYESEFAPNTFTTGLYVGVVGDFNKYWIIDSMAMEIGRDDTSETVRKRNRVYFDVRMQTDGAPVRAEAFARVKLG